MRYLLFTCSLFLTAQACASVTIGMYGDSTTAGAQTLNGVLGISTRSEPSALQDSLRTYFNQDITVVNEGVGGTQAAQLLKGQDGVHQPFSVEMSNSNADIVILNFGLNDQHYSDGHDPAFEAVSPMQYWGYLAQLIDIARSHNKIVVIQEPNPTKWQPAPGRLDTYVYVLRQAAASKNVPVVAQFNYIQAIPDWKSYLSEDGVHPKDALYAIKAKRTLDVILPLVERELHRGTVS